MDPAFVSYATADRAELERERALLPALAAVQTRAAANAGAARIAERFDMTRIYLFGSLARSAFRAESDIDLAVEGLAPGQLVDALGAAEHGCPFRVHVLPLEPARPELAAMIRAEEVVLWPRVQMQQQDCEPSFKAS